MKAQLKINKNFTRKLNRRLDALASKKVEVGHFAGDIHPTAKVDYATLAKWMEYGTDVRKADGSIGGIKAYRPLATTYFMYPLRNDKGIQKKILKYLLGSKVNINTLFNEIGKEYEERLKSVYGDSSILPSNEPSTIRKKKGSDKPLVDEGLLRAAITYKVSGVNS